MPARKPTGSALSAVAAKDSDKGSYFISMGAATGERRFVLHEWRDHSGGLRSGGPARLTTDL